MKSILYISMCYPNIKATHAGGKTVGYYSNRFRNESDIDVRIICKSRNNEQIKFCYDPKIISVEMPTNRLKKGLAYLVSLNSKFNPFCKYGNTITKYIRNKLLSEAQKLKQNGFYPNIVILEWTEMVLYLDLIKKIFPDSFIVSSEHDVKFQSLERKYKKESKIIKKLILFVRYKTIRKYEIKSLENSDLVVVQSGKDKNILTNVGINDSDILVISPYFMKSEHQWKDLNQNNIVIYGDMSREENYKSSIWFIENVFTKLDDSEINLIILGGNPPVELKQYENNNILVTGYVDDVFNYLDNSFCMVVPLQLGAGIKVKCLEALSYGIPLVTNDIGIEGIGAIEGRDYLLCNNAADFKDAVKRLRYEKSLRQSLSENSIKYAKENLNIEDSYRAYLERIINA